MDFSPDKKIIINLLIIMPLTLIILAFLFHEEARALVISYLVASIIFALLIILHHRKVHQCLLTINEAIEQARDANFVCKIEKMPNATCSIIAENLNEMFKSFQNREQELKSYQEEIRSKKDNLEAIFNSSNDGIITLSKDLKITNVNPTITEWVGLPYEKIVGRHLNEFVKCKCTLKMSDIDCADTSLCPILAHWSEDVPKEGFIVNHNTGKTTFIAINCSPIHGLAKSQEYFVAVFMNITKLKEIEKVKENFVATLTHDLRVPLLAENHTLKYFIKGSYGQLNETQLTAAENMLNSNEDLLKLVNNLLDVYKYESGTLELYKEKINLHNIVKSCITDLQSLIEKNSQIVKFNIPDNIPLVNADENEIKRVFMNLIGNSISYTQENGIIKIEAEQNESDVVIKIIDNGKGIPESELKNIFELYFTNAKKFRKIGTGLGLYLSKRIILAHNGKIWVESRIGHGSTFFISLPTKTEEGQQ
jgi:two-component system, NtrC family, sensor histidine kinase KinB